LGKIILNINGDEVETSKGKTVLEAALDAGIYIPHLCYHPNLVPFGACRLCIVEVEGMQGLPTACTTLAAEGMVVKTKTPQIDQIRRLSTELMLAGHPPDCTTCPKYLNCELQALKQYLGVSEELRVKRRPRAFPVNTSNPLFLYDLGRCILCGRCVRACYELRGVGVLSFIKRGRETYIGTAFDHSLADADCRFCGACVAVCPTGALRDHAELLEGGKSRRAALIPCKYACPVGIDVPRYVRLAAEGKFDESYAVVRERLPLPSVCGYICTAFCEDECRRGEVNEPIGIRALKRFVSENHSDLWKKNLKRPKATGKKVAILGSGPAGLTAGYYLARKGHEVTIFEQSSLPGGMLRQAISRKRLPKKALEEDIEEILNAGVKLKLNSPQMRIGELFDEKFDAVFLATGSTFVGPSALWLKEEGVELTPWGSIKVNPETFATSLEGVFAGGDVLLGGISEDFISSIGSGNKENFVKLLVDRLAVYRGDSSRSCIQAVASGRKATEAIDKYLGGDGVIDEVLLPAEEPKHWLGRVEGFADLKRVPAAYHSPTPQYAGLSRAEPPLSQEAAITEAGRCLRCDLRLLLSKPILAPKEELWVEFTAENVSQVPEVEGVYQLLDEEKNIIYVKGAMNLHRELEEQLEVQEKARHFMYEEEPMFTKRESELLQQYIAQHGQMPEGNRELEDLF